MLNTAVLTNEASFDTGLKPFEKMGEIRVFTPQRPAAVAPDHIRLLTNPEQRRPVSGILRPAADAVKDGVPVPNKTHTPLHIGEAWDALSLATATAADSADQNAVGQAYWEATAAVGVAQGQASESIRDFGRRG